MKLKLFLLIVLVALMLCPACKGAGTEYLFRLVPEAAATKEVSELDAYPICQAEGVYVTGNYDLVRSLEQQGDLLYYEENGAVCLMDYSEDTQRLAEEDWSRAILGADYAVARGNAGDGIRIGMIDSGVMGSFKDYTDAVIVPGVNYCALPESEVGEETEAGEEGAEADAESQNVLTPRRDTSDTIGHGTFAASLLFSRETGLCPKAELVPLKCFEAKDGGKIDAICEAIYDAVDVYHCDVINMSFGVKEDYETLKDAISYAFDQGVILVASAGNLEPGTVSSGSDSVFYPAAYEQVISVGSLDRNKVLASHSSQNGSIWVTAPGVAVRGLSMRTGSYISSSGTSYAAPFVSGAAALARSARTDLAPKDFMVLLAKTAEDLGEPGRDNAYGHGMLNLGLLLAAVTKDGDTMIPSYYNETLCLSHFQRQTENEMTWLARYGPDGGFSSLEELSGGRMNNIPVSENAPRLLLMRLDRESFAPLGPAIRYGSEAPPESP